jgi:hypothetical protein
MTTQKHTKSPLTSKKAFIPIAVTVLSLLLAALTDGSMQPASGGGADGLQCQRYWSGAYRSTDW